MAIIWSFNLEVILLNQPNGRRTVNSKISAQQESSERDVSLGFSPRSARIPSGTCTQPNNRASVESVCKDH